MHPTLPLVALLYALGASLVGASEGERHTPRVDLRGVHRRHHARMHDKPRDGPHGGVSKRQNASGAAETSVVRSALDGPESTSATPDLVVPAVEVEVADISEQEDTLDEVTGASSLDGTNVTPSTDEQSYDTTAKIISSLTTSTKDTSRAYLSAFFPINTLSSWSTAPFKSSSQLSSALSLSSHPLSDLTLRPTHVLTGTPYKYVTFAGKRAIRATYPKGSWNFQHRPLGGFSFYASGLSEVDLRTAKEATLAYSVYFEEGFQFVKGGKLPGFYGGNTDGGSISCSGGSRSDACFSTRFMWRTPTAQGLAPGELYTYLPPSFPANQRVCSVPPFSHCNPTYGASVGRGAWTFASGRWTTVVQRVRLNDVGSEDGEVQVWVDGKSVLSVTGLVLRNGAEGRIRGIQAQTFFGGSTKSWASPKTQHAYFADFSIAITERL